MCATWQMMSWRGLFLINVKLFSLSLCLCLSLPPSSLPSSVCLSVCPSVRLSVCPSVRLSVCLSVSVCGARAMLKRVDGGADGRINLCRCFSFVAYYTVYIDVYLDLLSLIYSVYVCIYMYIYIFFFSTVCTYIHIHTFNTVQIQGHKQPQARTKSTQSRYLLPHNKKLSRGEGFAPTSMRISAASEQSIVVALRTLVIAGGVVAERI